MFISSNLVSTRVRVHRVNRIDRARFSFHRRCLRPLAASSFPLCLPVDPSFLAANREPRRFARVVSMDLLNFGNPVETRRGIRCSPFVDLTDQSLANFKTFAILHLAATIRKEDSQREKGIVTLVYSAGVGY